MAMPQMVATGRQAKGRGRGRELEQGEYSERNVIFIVKNIFNEYTEDYLQMIFYH
ncbi:hypothetical protein NDS46_20800 [Paenibacillus thiaminolyticus]|uniref:hypothetical protein n=1 Tax=Paenibacillus thiaminolyticus TaxID=49283 RepID=UPI00232F414C|nr:hypothetical protein [Paenibacillus thiaminolyticus]WCF06769.1 hypothetical protein NDS46_20800 [Paenibacillus thiaminolyticus]